MPLLDPGIEDLDRIAEQIAVADRLVKEHLGEALDQSPEDLDRLQKLVERAVLAPQQTYELQCLGLALGRVLVRHVPGLGWAVIEDEYGRDPILRYRRTTLQFNVLTMISKRVEAGQKVDVRAMYDWTRSQVEGLKHTVD